MLCSKALSERSINYALRLENEKIQSENIQLRETLKKLPCLSCGGPILVEEDDHETCMEKLRLENAWLLQQHEKLSKLLASKNDEENPILQPTLTSSHDPPQESLLNQNVEIPTLEINPIVPSTIPSSSQHDPSHGSNLLNQNIENPTHDINPIVSSTLPSSPKHDPSHGNFPNQNIEIPSPMMIDPILPPTLLSSNDHPLQGSLLNQTFPILLQTLPSSNDPLQGSLLNQNIETLAIDHQNIPTITSLDQNVSNITPEPNQNVPAHDNEDIYAFDEDFPVVGLDFDALEGILDDCEWPQPMSTDIEKVLMTEIANTAMEELTRLLRMNEPLWFRSMKDEKFILQRETYEKIFHRFSRLKGHIESSKDSRIVSMGGTQLVEMFLDSDKWVDLFPTIVRKAQTIQVFESGLSRSRNGALQLMNAKMHILSKLIPSREFIFLRYCKQVEEGVWVIADVSFDSLNYEEILSHTWRFPSGCMIQEISDGSCMISWVEHVEVDDKIQTDRNEVICEENAYGAERWVLTLERTCERFTRTLETIPSSDARGVINSVEGMRSVMQLGHRMIKLYHGIFDMSSNVDILKNGKVRIFVRKNTELGQPKGMIVSAATFFRLPLSPQNVLDFLKDISKRPQVHMLKFAYVLLMPFIPKENAILILQESYMDPLESMVIYAPMDIETLNYAIKGGDSSPLPLLPSGFTITRDGQPNVVGGQSGGSLVTVGYQILACSAMEDLNMENSVAFVNTLVTSTVKKIKVALSC
ncbi:START domain [Sesbania bispinosa]|nr:START domain [Sesbania bispinosa]